MVLVCGVNYYYRVLVLTIYYILKGETMEEKKENIVCTVCREYGPGKLNDCHIDFMNCRVYDSLVERLAERLKQDVGDQTQKDS